MVNTNPHAKFGVLITFGKNLRLRKFVVDFLSSISDELKTQNADYTPSKNNLYIPENINRPQKIFSFIQYDKQENDILFQLHHEQLLRISQTSSPPLFYRKPSRFDTKEQLFVILQRRQCGEWPQCRGAFLLCKKRHNHKSSGFSIYQEANSLSLNYFFIHNLLYDAVFLICLFTILIIKTEVIRIIIIHSFKQENRGLEIQAESISNCQKK